MPSYLKGAGSTRETPQSDPIPGRPEMIENAAGGYTFAVTPLERLRRFLILGSEGGTFYASEQKATKENAAALRAVLDSHGPEAVEVIAEISESGRAPKNDQAIFALAMAASHPDKATRKAAWFALTRVCRIGTHVFMFVGFVEDFRGWGKGLRRAVAEWYYGDPSRLAYQLIKYREREGFTHDDVLRLCHATPPSAVHAGLYEWVAKPLEGSRQATDALPVHIEAFTAAQLAARPEDTVALIKRYEGVLPWEALKTEHTSDKAVNVALLEQGMPTGALIRQLAKLTRVGVLEPMGDTTAMVAGMLTDRERLSRARIHPIAILKALHTYKSGRSERGTGTWSPVTQIVDALDEAFYLSFDFVEPTNKRTLLALDISGSMSAAVLGMSFLSAREAAATMAMVTAKAEPRHEVVAFSDPTMDQPAGGWAFGDRQALRAGARDWWAAPKGSGGRMESRGIGSGLKTVTFSPRQRIDSVMQECNELPFGGTDCALPMLYALDKEREVDTFVVYTDSETWAGSIHPSQALDRYRRESGIPAKLIVVALSSSPNTIADPNDAGMLDVVGFDSAAPAAIADFAR